MFVPNAEELVQQEKGRNPERKVFREKMNTIPDLLVGCLKEVSDECLQRGLIGRETYDRTIDADSGHTSVYIRRILSSVTDKIKEDPKNLEEFIKAVLEPMSDSAGDSADNLITKLRKYMTQVLFKFIVDLLVIHLARCWGY